MKTQTRFQRPQKEEVLKDLVARTESLNQAPKPRRIPVDDAKLVNKLSDDFSAPVKRAADGYLVVGSNVNMTGDLVYKVHSEGKISAGDVTMYPVTFSPVNTYSTEAPKTAENPVSTDGNQSPLNNNNKTKPLYTS